MSAGCCPAVSPAPPGPPAAPWVPSSPLLGKLRSRKGAHGHMCCVSEPQAGYAVHHTGSAYIPPRQVVNNSHFLRGPSPASVWGRRNCPVTLDVQHRLSPSRSFNSAANLGPEGVHVSSQGVPAAHSGPGLQEPRRLCSSPAFLVVKHSHQDMPMTTAAQGPSRYPPQQNRLS